MRGEVNTHTGILVDLAEVRAAIAQVRDQLDHHFLDEVAGLGPATLENVCHFVYQQLSACLPMLRAVTVERPASGDKCRYQRPPH